MSCNINSEALEINLPFPKEYELLEDMLSIDREERKIELKEEYLNKKKIFRVKPEIDLPYKMRSMLLSQKDSYLTMNNLAKRVDKINHGIADPLSFSSHGSFPWKEYMFQMPEIEQILGIKRDFTVKKLEDVFQNPVIFLAHLYYVVELDKVQKYLSLGLRNIILDLIEKAILAYEKKMERIGFTEEQMETVFKFFLDERVAKNLDLVIKQPKEAAKDEGAAHEQHYGMTQRMFDALLPDDMEMDESWTIGDLNGGWDIGTNGVFEAESDRYEKIYDKLDKIMDAINEEISKSGAKQIEEIDFDKGEKLCFPVYMRTIMLGIHEYYTEFPFTALFDTFIDRGTKEEGFGATLWSKHEIPFTDIFDKKLWVAYKKFDTYRYFINRWEFCFANMSDMFDDEKKIYTYLEKIYVFYMGTLARLFWEKDEYKGAALDAFEKIYSLFLLYTETNLIYERVAEAVEYLLKEENNKNGKVMEEDERMEEKKLGVARYVAEKFSAEVLRDIYCSPGIYHRVSLSRYINNIDITSDELAEEYLINENVVLYTRSEAEGLREKIAEINKAYYIAEGKCIRYIFKPDTSNKKDISLKLDDINSQCENVDEYKEYKEYYKEIYNKILDADIEQNHKLNFDKSTARRAAKRILTSEKFKSPAYRLIHFWVIVSNYFPKDFSEVTLKNE